MSSSRFTVDGSRFAAPRGRLPTGNHDAFEQRRWVRLSSACNNRCLFCHDRDNADGSLRPFDEVLADLRAGVAEGAARAVLSGGEPTLHPRLPDAVRSAKALGYRWVQLVTNGRRLAYPACLRALLDAGLDEATFSLHGSRPGVHDPLVGVPGAFAQAFRGLRAALASRRLAVSVDVVLNRRNLADVPRLVRAAADAGVREFDLLWLTPFGAAADRSGRARRLFLGPRDAPAVRRVVEAARRAGVVAWTNRMPAAFLEGHEALIQDPSKLEDEVRGRAALVERLVRDGRPLPCRERWRCRRCALDGWCALAHRAVREARGEIAPRALRLDPADARQVARLLARPGGRGTRLWLRTVAPPEAWHPAVLGRAAQGDPWRLEAPASVLLAALPAVGPRVLLHLRPRAGGEAAPARLFVAPRELVLPLTARLARSSAPPTPRGVARFPRVLALPDGDLAARDGWPFAGGARGAVQAWRRWATGVEGWPPCLAGGLAVRGAPRPLDLGWLDDEGRIDPRALLRTYVAERHRARSFRCARCGAGPGCPGLPVAMARRAGFRVLRPVDRS